MRHLLPLLLLAAGQAGAEELPACTPAREGMVLCQGEKLCLCRHHPGGTLAGRPPGLRWECGALRPGCGMVPGATPPAHEQPPLLLPWPPGGGGGW